MSICKKIALGGLFGFLTIFSLNKFVCADTINVNYDGNYEIDNSVVTGSYGGFDYEFYSFNIYCDSTVHYYVDSITIATSLEIDTTDLEDINVGFYYCFGGSNCTTVTDIFTTYNVNYYDYYYENPRSEPYNVLRFTYIFDTPVSLDTEDFYFYLGVKNYAEITPWFEMNYFLCLPNSVNSELSYQDIYNQVYNEFSNSFDSLNNDYTTLQTTYNTLNSNYTSLQSTYNILQQNYNTLQSQYNELANSEYSFNNLMWAISTIPFGIFGSMFNFDLLGINFFALVTGIITAFIVVWLIKKFILK